MTPERHDHYIPIITVGQEYGNCNNCEMYNTLACWTCMYNSKKMVNGSGQPKVTVEQEDDGYMD